MAVPQSQAGIDGFIPELWAAAIQEPFEKQLVYAQAGITNRTYDGEITGRGDAVHVSTIGTPTIRDYDASKDLTIEDLQIEDNALKIDQGDYFAFRVEDVSALQAAGPLRDPATRQAATALRDKADAHVAKVMADGAGSKVGTVEINPRSDDAWGLVLELRKRLNAHSVPHAGRFLIVGPEFESAILRAPEFYRVNESGSEETLRNGVIGRLAGFDVFVSGNAPVKSGRETVIAGVPDAVAFAQQITKVEAMREPYRFADLVKGLLVYGAKVFLGQGLASADVKISIPTTAEPAA